jgi:hypothetical protein
MSTTPHTTLYVALDGNDMNPGTEQEPFATFERAIDGVDELRGKREGPISVLFRAGTYYETTAIITSFCGTGTPNSPVTFAAYPGETVTLSTAVLISNSWRPFRDGIYKCELPEEIYVSELFINGIRQHRARFPNYDAIDPTINGSGYTNVAKVGPERPNNHFHYDPATFTSKTWTKPEDAVVHIFPEGRWGNLQWRVRSIDRERHAIHLGEGGFQINANVLGHAANGLAEGCRFYIENVFEELDFPGEWYFDEDTRTLYVIPLEGVDIGSALVEAPQNTQLVEVIAASNVTFKGFRFAHVCPTFMETYEAPSLGDWTLYRGGTIEFDGAEDCAIEDCFFDAVGGNAVFINNSNKRIRITGNKFTQCGDSAVCLVGSKHLTHGTQQEYPADCVVSNNLIHDCGVYGKQTAGVFLSVCKRTTVSHNRIYSMPRSAICVNDGTWGGHIIEHNDISDTVKETGDHGPFNSWGRERYWCLQQSHGPEHVSHSAGNVLEDACETTIIRHNRFREDHGWGIDLDDGTSNYRVENNLCLGISIKLREGAYRTVVNNIIINPAMPINTHVCYEDNHDRIVRNIVVTNTKTGKLEVDLSFNTERHGGTCIQGAWMPPQGRWADEIDFNLYFSDLGHFIARFAKRGEDWLTYNLEEWQALGYDEHSIFTDPLFIDPANGDFRVKEDSPALALGFKNFDMTTFGLLPDFPKQWLDAEDLLLGP